MIRLLRFRYRIHRATSPSVRYWVLIKELSKPHLGSLRFEQHLREEIERLYKDFGGRPRRAWHDRVCMLVRRRNRRAMEHVRKMAQA